MMQTQLSPRRRLYAQRLLAAVCWRGRKLILDESVFADLGEIEQLDRQAVNQAADDLYELGVADMRRAGNTYALIALADDIDANAPAPKHLPQAKKASNR